MNLEKRVEELEQRRGTPDDMIFIVISFLGCDPAKTGSERAIEHEVTGYSASGRERHWEREPGEAVQDLRARIKQELRHEGHKVYAVCECYASDPQNISPHAPLSTSQN